MVVITKEASYITVLGIVISVLPISSTKSTVNISPESDNVQVLPLPTAGCDHNLRQYKPGGGDHNVPQPNRILLR
jgi:hypothetical protein